MIEIRYIYIYKTVDILDQFWIILIVKLFSIFNASQMVKLLTVMKQIVTSLLGVLYNSFSCLHMSSSFNLQKVLIGFI